MSDDIVLLRQYARTNNPDAFAALFGRYAGMVYGTCLRVIGNPHDAEDIAQECFVELARGPGAISVPLPVWLHVVATSRSLDALRRAAARKRSEEAAVINNGNGAAIGAAWPDVAPRVDQALSHLPEGLRTAVILHYLQGRSQSEIAAEFGLNQGTVSRRLEKGLAELRKEMEKVGVVVSAVALAMLLRNNAAAAAPPTLMTALGKIALAGIRGEGGPGAVAPTLHSAPSSDAGALGVDSALPSGSPGGGSSGARVASYVALLSALAFVGALVAGNALPIWRRSRKPESSASTVPIASGPARSAFGASAPGISVPASAKERVTESLVSGRSLEEQPGVPSSIAPAPVRTSIRKGTNHQDANARVPTQEDVDDSPIAQRWVAASPERHAVDRSSAAGQSYHAADPSFMQCDARRPVRGSDRLDQ